MRAATLTARRSRTRGGLLLAMLAVVALVVFLLVGMVGYLAVSTDAAVRNALVAAPATAASVQLSTRLADDSDAQADAVELLIDTAFAGTEVTTHRTVRSTPITAAAGDRDIAVILAADPGLAAHAALVAGEWPNESAAGTPGVAVQATAAEELELALGDTLTVEGRQLVVTGTWLPLDATDPYWFADPAAASGFDRLSGGPLVIPEAVLADVPVRSYARWTIVPVVTAMTADSVPRLAAALTDLAAGVERAGGLENIELTGTLPDRLDTVQRGVGVAVGLVAVPGVLVAVIGFSTLAQLARLLVAVRRDETTVLRARGASVVQLTMVSVGEATAASVVGGLLGGGVVGALLAAAAPAAVGTAVWPIAASAVAVAILVWGVVAWRAALTGVARGDSGRARTPVTAGVTVLVLVAAGLSLWQFKLYGSPLLTGPDGSIRVDPLTVVAPTLTLLALAMIGLLGFGPAVRRLEKPAARSKGILPALPTRQVARRVPVFGFALLLVTLSVGGTTLAAAYSQSWSVANATAAQLRNGADVRVELSPPPTVEGPSSLVSTAPYLRLDGVTDAATVLATEARIADDSARLIALAAERMPAILPAADGLVDPARLRADLAADPTGVPLTSGVLELTVHATAAAGQRAGVIEVFAWLDDADGSIARVSLGSVTLADAVAGAVTVGTPVPDARAGDWRMLAVEATLSGADGARGVEVAVGGPGIDLAVSLSSVDPTDRAFTYPEPEALPVVVTEVLAERLSLTDGTRFTLRLPGTASVVDAVVVGTTEVVPAAAGRFGLVADLPTLNRALLYAGERMPQPSEVWLSADAGSDLAGPVAAVSHTAAAVTTLDDRSGGDLVAPAITALWWGMAGALLLAVIAVLAITGTFARDRRGEVLVLRALGMSASEQGRNRLLELVAVTGAAVVTGIVIGLIASVLTVAEFVTTAAGALAPVALRFDVLGWLTLTFALVAALLTISTGYAGRVSRQARDTEYREGTR